MSYRSGIRRQTSRDYVPEEGAPDVDLVHEVVAFHRGDLGARQVDGAGVVDQHVHAAKLGLGLSEGGGHLVLVPDVYYTWQAFTAGFFD